MPKCNALLESFKLQSARFLRIDLRSLLRIVSTLSQLLESLRAIETSVVRLGFDLAQPLRLELVLEEQRAKPRKLSDSCLLETCSRLSALLIVLRQTAKLAS